MRSAAGTHHDRELRGRVGIEAESDSRSTSNSEFFSTRSSFLFTISFICKLYAL